MSDKRCAHEPDVLVDSEAWARWAFDGGQQLICPWGNCTHSACPDCGRLTGNGVGLAGCPCDTLPGWDARFYASLPKPHPPMKAKGRHGGRVAASARKHGRALADFRLWQGDAA
jgi:hypothetical protein